MKCLDIGCSEPIDPEDTRVVPYRDGRYHIRCWLKKIGSIGEHREWPHPPAPIPFRDMAAAADLQYRRQQLHEIMTACTPMLDKIREALGNVFCGESEIADSAGAYGILLTIDEDMVRGTDKGDTDDRRLVLLTGLSEVKKFVLAQAARANLRPFAFASQYRDGTVLIAGSLQ